ncbi:MAG: BNR-repeat neuraminidase N-terminal domain-containing protein [Bacteroidota bacterium]|nr:BNR-repeat neuraminidase N-terminal domain-containing protein [Bacteroidota bacterium]
MRKFVLLISTIVCAMASRATVGNYTFASSSGTYTPISGTTLFSGAWDDGSSGLLTIPFSFIYNGTPYTTLSVNTNGFITLGAVPASVYCGLQSSAPNSIAAYGTDLVGASVSSTIQYTTIGSAPNRQFIIQWTDCDHYTGTTSLNHWSFQIILNETTNTVQVVWGNSTDVTTMGANNCADVATESGNVGLLGANTTDFNIRSVTNGVNTWATSTSGSFITAVCNMSSTNIPASGLTFTWTPGPILPMTYTSSTTAFLNNGLAVAQGTTNNQVIQVQVVVSGTSSPFTITSLSLSTTGSTNAGADIANAKVYFTGVSNIFSTATQYGSTFTNPNGAYTVSGSATLSEGVNYFWVTYDIKPAAVLGDNFSGCCNQIIGSGTMGTRVPTITCPAGTQTIAQIGTWSPLTNLAPTTSGGLMLLLSDGTVMAKSTAGGSPAGIGNSWNKLTPDIHGSYINGTWSTLAPMANSRLYFSSQILKDGRVYVAGGEYGSGGAQGEVYNPLTNTWTSAPAPGQTVSDANSEIIPDGRILQALVAGSLTGTLIYNPVTNTYSAGPTALGIHNESAWVKLADNSILYVNRLSTASERYIPSLNQWVADGTVPVQLYDAFGDEAGAGLLLPDGRAFFLGSSGHTAYYTPSGTNSPGTWAAGPDIPSGRGTPDAPAAIMVNGKILCAVSPAPTSANHFPSPTSFYEFNYLTNSFTLCNAPTGGTTLNHASYVANMLNLPDGTILYNDQDSVRYYVYNPGGTPVAAGKPTISNITPTSCTSFIITGTLFNGISEGAAYGDDWQMATNYPLVRLTSGANVYYARTSNWNSTGVRRGSAADTARFDLPASLPAGTYSLVVVANGISSDPVTFNTTITPSVSISASPSNAVCSGTSVTFTATNNLPSSSYQWKKNGAVVGGNSATYTDGSLVDGDQVTCTISSAATCVSPSSAVSNIITMAVDATLITPVISPAGPISACPGVPVLLSVQSPQSGVTYLWSDGGTGATHSVTDFNGSIYCWGKNATCNSSNSNTVTITVGSVPAAVTVSGSGLACSSMTLTASGGSGGTIYWQGTTSNGTSLLTPSTSQSVNSSGTYYFRSFNSCGWGPQGSATVTINTPPNNWTGVVNTAWETPGNWSCGVVADATTDVFIGSGTVIVNSNAICRTLTLAPGVIFIVNPGFSITVMH